MQKLCDQFFCTFNNCIYLVEICVNESEINELAEAMKYKTEVKKFNLFLDMKQLSYVIEIANTK